MSKPADRKFRPGRAGALVAVVALAVAPGCHSAHNFKERVQGAVAHLVGSNYDDPLAESKLQEAENLSHAEIITLRLLAHGSADELALPVEHIERLSSLGFVIRKRGQRYSLTDRGAETLSRHLTLVR